MAEIGAEIGGGSGGSSTTDSGRQASGEEAKDVETKGSSMVAMDLPGP